MRIIIIAALASLVTGCANLPPDLQRIGDKAQMALAKLPSISGHAELSFLSGRGAAFDAPLPADGIRARDQELTEALAKFGRFAAKQREPMTITLFASRADHDYLVRSIKAGFTAAKSVSIVAQVDDVNSRIAIRSTREMKGSL